MTRRRSWWFEQVGNEVFIYSAEPTAPISDPGTRLRHRARPNKEFTAVASLEPVENADAKSTSDLKFFFKDPNDPPRKLAVEDFLVNKNPFCKKLTGITNKEAFTAEVLKNLKALHTEDNEEEKQSHTETEEVAGGVSQNQPSTSSDTPGTSGQGKRKTSQTPPPPLLKRSKLVQPKGHDEQTNAWAREAEEAYLGLYEIDIGLLQEGLKLREVNPVFMEHLQKEMASYSDHSYQPLCVINTQVTDKASFKVNLVNVYHYDVVGGIHNFLACRKTNAQFPEKELFQKRICNVYHGGLSEGAQYFLANKHNVVGGFRHAMTVKEKIELCRKMKLSGSLNWKKESEDLLKDTTKNSDIATMIALAMVSENVFRLLVEGLQNFQQGETKDQKLKAKEIPDIKLYIFRKFVNLSCDAQIAVLRGLIAGEMSVSEFADECSVLYKLNKIQRIFMDFCSCLTWEEAMERFPCETTREALLPFTTMKLAPVPDALKNFCKRAGQDPISRHMDAAVFKGDNETMGVVTMEDPKEIDITKLSKHYSDVCGFALAITTMPQDWNETDVVAFSNNVVAINASKKIENFYFVVLCPLDMQAKISLALERTGHYGNMQHVFYHVSGSKVEKGKLFGESLHAMVLASKKAVNAKIVWKPVGGSDNVLCLEKHKEPGLMSILVQTFSKQNEWILEACSSSGSALLAGLGCRRNAVVLQSDPDLFKDIQCAVARETLKHLQERQNFFTVDLNGKFILVDNTSYTVEVTTPFDSKVSQPGSRSESLRAVDLVRKSRHVETFEIDSDGTSLLPSNIFVRVYRENNNDCVSFLDLRANIDNFVPTTKQAIGYSQELLNLLLNWKLEHLPKPLVFENETVKFLRNIANEIHQNRRKKNFGVLGGSATSIVGSTMTIIGCVLLPFTMGASTALIGTGIAVGIVGSAVSIGFSVDKLFGDMTRKEKVKRHLSQFVDIQMNMIIALAYNFEIRSKINEFISFTRKQLVVADRKLKKDIKRYVSEHRAGHNVNTVDIEGILEMEKDQSKTLLIFFQQIEASIKKNVMKLDKKCLDTVLRHKNAILREAGDMTGRRFIDFAKEYLNLDESPLTDVTMASTMALDAGGRTAFRTGSAITRAAIDVSDDAVSAGSNALKIAKGLSIAGIVLGAIGIVIDAAFAAYSIYDLATGNKDKLAEGLNEISNLMEAFNEALSKMRLNNTAQIAPKR